MGCTLTFQNCVKSLGRSCYIGSWHWDMTYLSVQSTSHLAAAEPHVMLRVNTGREGKQPYVREEGLLEPDVTWC